MKHIYITREIPEIATTMLSKAGFKVTVNQRDHIPTKQDLIRATRNKNYDGIITLLTDNIDDQVLDSCPTVKIVSNYAVGFNNIDLAATKHHGVAVTNTPVSNEHVAEFTLGLILALATRILEGDHYLKAGKYKGWSPNLLNGTDIFGMTLGLIGSGRIGSSVAERAVKGFGMKVVYYDPIKNPILEKKTKAKRLKTVEDVLMVADYVSLHVPLIPETHHLINEDRLKLMKPSAFLINTARGPVVDEKALVEALKNKQIRGAAIDVFENEPKVSKELRGLENCILTPHIASSRESCRKAMAIMAAQNIIDFFDGKKPVGLVVG